ncbi:MAG: MoaD/ThiS family protein [Desulfobacterota bacterium]|nr:MoaD/ThiS family protein [Thermodesulfobacteriota bacterium]
MPTVHCLYYSTVQTAVGKKEETITLPDGATVEDVLNELVRKYGSHLARHLYSEGWIDGRYYKTAAVYVNKKRIQWLQDFPLGIKTMLQEGDELSFGLIMGGG